jgi:hypothetical protein
MVKRGDAKPSSTWGLLDTNGIGNDTSQKEL